MHISSYMLSVLMHLILVLVVWLWPTSTLVQLDKPMMQISLTMGAPGGDKMASSVLGPQGQPSPQEVSTKPAPVAGAQQQIAGEAAALPDENRLERLEALAQASPESQPQEKPQPVESKPEPKPAPAPAPKPPDVALSNSQRKPEEKKPEPKPEPKPDPKPKPEAKPDPKPEKKPESKPEKKPETKTPSSRDILAQALSDAQKKTGGQSAPRRGNASSSVAGALASAERKVRTEGAGGGGGGEGSGPGGGGIYDVYAGMVILAVRPNWSMPTYSRDQLVAQVRVRMDVSGNVLAATLEQGSGRPDFDASCVNAVLRTKALPPPPPGQEEIVIGFNSLEMSGR